MRTNRIHEHKTDVRNTDQWRYACHMCGTPFEHDVSSCGDCGSTDIVPIDDLNNIA